MFKLSAYLYSSIIVILSLQVKAKLPLIFPPTAPTRVQWIVGIGIPLGDLNYEAMTSGWVLKAEYFLPSTVEQLKKKSQLPITVRKLENPSKFEQFLATTDELARNSTNKWFKKSNNKHVLTSSYRWTVYKGLEGLASRMGLSGRDCMLKSICEAAETPFHYYNGLFSEMLYVLLTPSSSNDPLSMHSDNEYFHAETMGRSGAGCQQVFKACPRSLLSQFSNLHKLSQGIFKIIG